MVTSLNHLEIVKNIRAVKDEHAHRPSNEPDENENVIDFQPFKNGTNS